MLITVPRSLMIYPPGYGGDGNEQLTFGLGGLGQDSTGFYEDPTETGGVVLGPTDTGDFNVQTLGIPDSTLSPTYGVITAPASSSPNSTTAQDIAALGPALAAASKAISVASGPYAIPNSNYIYNPATGQILLNGAAVGTYNPLTGQLSTVSSISSYLPILLGVGALVLVVSMLGGKK